MSLNRKPENRNLSKSPYQIEKPRVIDDISKKEQDNSAKEPKDTPQFKLSDVISCYKNLKNSNLPQQDIDEQRLDEMRKDLSNFLQTTISLLPTLNKRLKEYFKLDSLENTSSDNKTLLNLLEKKKAS